MRSRPALSAISTMDNRLSVEEFTACAKLLAVEQCMAIHEEIIRSRLQCDVFVGNALVDMYVKCVYPEMAHNVFDKVSQRDVVSWNMIIDVCTQNGGFDVTLKPFLKIIMSREKLNLITFVSLLSTFVVLVALEQGKQVHEDVIRTGLQRNVVVGSTLVYLCAKCGRIDNAHNVFDKIPQRDLVLPNTMIVAYSRDGFCADGLGFCPSDNLTN